MKSTLLLASLLLVPPHIHAEASVYAGEQNRAIKALSPAEISSLRSGHGMGLARPAELNGYPGPRHVLDSAGELGLTPVQMAELTRVFEAMHAAVLPLGEKLIERETSLDRLFTGRRATEDTVRALTLQIGQLQGELRAVHLNAHLATVKILNPDQVAAYNQLRGYDAPAAATTGHAGHNHGAP